MNSICRRNIVPTHPGHLPFPDHVHGFIALNRSLCRLEFPKPLLSVHTALDGSVILFQNVVHILHGSVTST